MEMVRETLLHGVTAMAEGLAPTLHLGAGIARRAAFHERRRTERDELDGAVLPKELETSEHETAACPPASVCDDVCGLPVCLNASPKCLN